MHASAARTAVTQQSPGSASCSDHHAVELIGIDHVACDESVLECDMSDTPLDEASLDVAVFSLSLMGANWSDYLKEAYRTLKPYGHLFIAEPQGRWQGRKEKLANAVQAAGFSMVGRVEQRYDFLYLTALKV